MPSSRTKAALVASAALVVLVSVSSRARAQQVAQGFAVDRLYRSAPGGGWVVMDALDMRGGLGGAAEMSLGYAHNALQPRSSDGSQRVAVVADKAAADFGFAVTRDRVRLYLNMTMPLVTRGHDGSVGDFQFSAPPVDLGSHPDTLLDTRIGLDARVVGDSASAFRVGVGSQLFVPSGERLDYATDGTYRAMGRVLFAGDVGLFTAAGQIGVHVRPLDDSPTPDSPRGSEGLFGAAAGAKLLDASRRRMAFIVGPELFGATAFRSFLGSTATALEALLSARLEGTADDAPQARVKLGVGAGIINHVGAPDWRLVFAIEVFDQRSDRDKDGTAESKPVASPQTTLNPLEEGARIE